MEWSRLLTVREPRQTDIRKKCRVYATQSDHLSFSSNFSSPLRREFVQLHSIELMSVRPCSYWWYSPIWHCITHLFARSLRGGLATRRPPSSDAVNHKYRYVGTLPPMHCPTCAAGLGSLDVLVGTNHRLIDLAHLSHPFLFTQLSSLTRYLIDLIALLTLLTSVG